MKLAAVTLTAVLICLVIVMRRWRAPAARVDIATCFVILAVAGIFLGYFILVMRAAAAPENARTGDLDVYLRTAWAAKTGESLYQTADSRGWHYIYPPLVASLLVPFADPPPDAPADARAAAIPYEVSASLWYWFSVVCLLASVHWLALALADREGGEAPRRFSQGWWNVRLAALLIVMPFALEDLRRGQATALILLCLAGCGVSIVRQQSLRAGCWLGIAAALKLFPAYLLIYPLWRRDGRFLATAIAVAVAASLLPITIIGPTAALAAYREFASERLRGEASGGGDAAVAEELHGTNSSIQSFEYMIYDVLNPDRKNRAGVPPKRYFLAHIGVSIALTAAALWTMRRRSDRTGEYLFFAALVVLAVPVLPVSRPHYYLLTVMPVAGLLATEFASKPRRPFPLITAALALLLAGFLDAARLGWALDFGLATLAGMILVALALTGARRSEVRCHASS